MKKNCFYCKIECDLYLKGSNKNSNLKTYAGKNDNTNFNFASSEIYIEESELKPNLFFCKKCKIIFSELCDVNFGAEDYLSIAEKCKFVVIENIPKFNNENSNQQKRFITLIDIFYEKKIPLMISISTDLNNLGTSNLLSDAFKRTLSRLYELTSPKFHYVD